MPNASNQLWETDRKDCTGQRCEKADSGKLLGLMYSLPQHGQRKPANNYKTRSGKCCNFRCNQVL